MRKLMIYTALLLTALLLPPRANASKLKVVTTLSDIGWIAARVGGQDVRVKVLCPGHQDPHYLPAKPSLTKKLRSADLLIYNGLELEMGWLSLLVETARNPRIRPGSRGELDCSAAIVTILDKPTGQVDRSGGDIHPLGNPHYLLDPRHGVAIAHLIAERLAQLDPESAEGYRERARVFDEDMSVRIAAWKQAAAALDGYPVIVYHQHWEYLMNWLGMVDIGSIEHRPGISPSPRHVEEIVGRGKSQPRLFVIAATWDNLKIAGKAVERMEAPLVVLPGAVGSLKEAVTYPEMFDLIVNRLIAAAEAGVRKTGEN